MFKKGNFSLINNYRPISNLSSLSKAFERCIVAKLRKIDHDLLFGPNQHAYKPFSSTTTACLTIQDYLATNLDLGKIVLLYTIDLSSAFDVLRPSLMVKNLIELGVDKTLVRVILSFLSDRTGFVDIEGHCSDIIKFEVIQLYQNS